MKENEVATHILDCCFAVHRELGPGLFESVYASALEHEFQTAGLRWERERPVPVVYKGVPIGPGFRLDFIVEESVILELKAMENILPVHKKQLLTYLRLCNLRLGLLVNFNESLLHNGITRVANKLF